ncbi:MAG: hypothetical protein WCE93_13020, partial [Nitrososphaeraceae archaeon]
QLYIELTFIMFTQAHNFLSNNPCATFFARSSDGKVDSTMTPLTRPLFSLCSCESVLLPPILISASSLNYLLPT